MVRSMVGEWKTNLVKMESKLNDIKHLPDNASGVFLHLGCGPQVFNGFINIDKYVDHDSIIKADMYKPPIAENTASVIYSSHSLEHLPFRLAKLALHNWYRVLKKDGTLFLAIPDLEETMRIMLDPEVPSEVKWGWYVYTLFGYQVDPDKYSQNKELDLPIEPGQFHTCGFTKGTIRDYLTGAGFSIKELYNYDGYGTPSIWVEAVKSSKIPGTPNS